jgi:predicted PurR-regulated permease PerM
MDDRRRAVQPSRSARVMPLLLGIVSVAFAWVLLPIGIPILWGVVVALLFAPLHRRLLPRLGGRATLAALLTMLAVLLIVVLPFALLTAALANEAAQIYQRIESGDLDPASALRIAFAAMPEAMRSVLAHLGLADFDELRARLSAALAQGSKLIATQALSVGQNTLQFMIGLGVTLYLAFFLIRDGAQLAVVVRRAIPLDPLHQQELIDKFTTVTRAAVQGNLLVAAVQGALGGLAFWALGLGNALLGGVVMGALSLLPAVGAALVWVPVAAYLLITGAPWQAGLLAAWGMLVIGSVDNLLRPILVGKVTRMPDWLVMVSTLGGIGVFGINGFVLGPAVAAMFIAVWHIDQVMHRS